MKRWAKLADITNWATIAHKKRLMPLTLLILKLDMILTKEQMKIIEKHNRIAMKLYENRNLYKKEHYEHRRKRLTEISNIMQKKAQHGLQSQE